MNNEKNVEATKCCNPIMKREIGTSK